MNDLMVNERSVELSERANFWESIEAFKEIQRIAQMFSQSDLVPAKYKNNVANTAIALDMASRMGASPLGVMQNLYVVHGNPGWAGKFVLARIRTCGLYRNVRFELSGSGDDEECRLVAEDKSGNTVNGPGVSYAMAKKEGWWNKNGSKWQTMPELMRKYRAASFFGNTECPELLLGIRSAEELEDIEPVSTEGSGADRINDIIDAEFTGSQDEPSHGPSGQKKEEKSPKPEKSKPAGKPLDNRPGNPKLVQKYKDKVDKCKSRIDIDNMRLRERLNVERELNHEDATEVFSFWQDIYESLS